MRIHPVGFVLLTCLLGSSGLQSQEKPVWEVTRLADSLYKLTADGGGYPVKVIASVGNDGILLVDSGEREKAKDLLAALRSLQEGAPRVVINTHSHIEHIGGNTEIARGSLVIGHPNLRRRMRSGYFLFEEFPDSALPQITFTDALTLHFNGEEIRLVAFPGAHDDSDIIVWFTRSKVACVGALCNGLHFPSVDGETGDVRRYAETARKVMSILPEDVKVIPGHGEDCSLVEYRAFTEMLEQTADVVRRELAKGKDLATLQKENVLRDWKPFEASYVSLERWTQYLTDGFRDAKAERALKKTLFEPLYYALKEKGVEGAVATYQQLKTRQSETYRFDDTTIAIVGYMMFKTGRHREAVAFFELSLNEYPRGQYAAVCHSYLGSAFEALDDTAAAVQHYRKTLEIDPTAQRAAARLKELEKK